MQSGGAAGSKKQGEQGSRGPKRGQAKGGPERAEARQRGQTALAVQGAIAAGMCILQRDCSWCCADESAAGPLDSTRGLLANCIAEAFAYGGVLSLHGATRISKLNMLIAHCDMHSHRRKGCASTIADIAPRMQSG